MTEYTYFWSGPFSQWYPSEFTIYDRKFNCAEQYMMYKKAMLFDDTAIAAKIMQSNDPRTQKALGRKVKNFDPEIWNDVCKQIVFDGNYAKFSQNTNLRYTLFSTSPTILVEASPYDAIWGIGLNEAMARRTPANEWPGTNWLGLTLTAVRDKLISENNLKGE